MHHTAPTAPTAAPVARPLHVGRSWWRGAPRPRVPFRLQWQLEGCQPLGPDPVPLDGGVLLTVDPRGDRLLAEVQPQQLRVAGAGTGDTAGLAGGFAASVVLR